MEKYGVWATFNALTGGDVLRFDDLAKLPYAVVFQQILWNQDMEKYRKEYDRIMQKKANDDS